MKYIAARFFACFSLILFCLSTGSLKAASIESCDCSKLACDPCSTNKGTTFYSAKCGQDGARVKSCARPTCIPIPDPTAECPNPPQASSGPREPVVVSKGTAIKEEASESAAPLEVAGKVKVMSGSVSVVDPQGRMKVVTGEAEIHEGDKVESGADGAALVKLKGGNKVHVLQDTALQIQEHKNPEVEASRKTLLHLIRGKIRNQVEQKYNGQTTYYRVVTKGAVAGVRGTDFVVEHHEGAKLETKVETLKGKVTFGKEAGEGVEIGRGQGATFTAELKGGKDGDESYDKVVIAGTFNPVYNISEDGLKELDRVTNSHYARNHKPKSKDSAICVKPKGLFNQCLWRCSGNSERESKCRTDLPGVECVRLRCNGNGQWADETKLAPSTGKVQCPAKGDLVKDCDY
jgi:ferric-dicitrate binding protein FerR (iron transport regulator)